MTAPIHPPGPYAAIVEAVSEDDRQWFEEHPGVDERIRAYVPGEFLDAPSTAIVRVLQLTPGARVRQLLEPVRPWGLA